MGSIPNTLLIVCFMAHMKLNRNAVLLGFFSPSVVTARPWTGDFDFPIGAFLLFAGFFLYWLKGAVENPVGATRTVVACVVVLAIGLGIPMSLMKFDLDLGGWLILVWAATWILAAKVGFFIAGVRDGDRDEKP